MLKFISFGSGSSGNCYYLYTENEGLLIDTGIGTRTLKKFFHDYGLNYLNNNIGAILVTHDHADHIKSVGSLSKKFNLPVYASKLVHRGMDKNYCMKCKIARDRRKYVEPGNIINIGNFQLLPFKVPHDSSENIGYTIRYKDIIFTLLTDVGHVTDEMNGIIQNTNYLVIEANYDVEMLKNGPYPEYLKNRIRNGNGHLSNMQCAEAVAANYTKKLHHIWLCHLSEENNNPETALGVIKQTLFNSGINTNKHVEIDVLRRKQPTGIFDLV